MLVCFLNMPWLNARQRIHALPKLLLFISDGPYSKAADWKSRHEKKKRRKRAWEKKKRG